MKVTVRRTWQPALLMFASFFTILSLWASAASSSRDQQPTGKDNFDGPAELPRVFIKSLLIDTPSPGKIFLVKSGDNLQDAINRASCGDTIKLESGASFVGRFLMPKKACDDRHWIIVRTSAPDDSLPAEGTRISPCYAGIASLPGRPAFHCTSVTNKMAKVTFAGHNSGPILFADGANHYRFIGLEITREPSPASIIALASPDGMVAADHLIFDRVWIHGSAQDETRRGLYLNGTTFVAIVDSFFNDFHCVAKSGSCTDSQAIGGGGGDLPSGPYKIVNNFLEAAGENVLFGGGRATITASDIEIRHNHLFKPIIWMPKQPGFVGGTDGNPFIVKNHFELKNAQRVLFEGNVLENSWGGFSQTGFSILLTPKNQYNGPLRNNLCPLCRVTDITIRDCTIAHVGSGFQIANAPETDGAFSAAGERYSIHDLVIDDLDGKKYAGFGAFMVLISNHPTLNNVRFDHITAVTPRVFISAAIKRAHIMNFVFTNNLIGASERQISSSSGGPEDCVFEPNKQGPAGILKNCFDGGTFSHNAIINGTGAWPPGNFTPKDIEAVGFVRNASGTEAFRLCSAKNATCKNPSKYVNAGSDEKDIGADIDAIISATRGVAE